MSTSNIDPGMSEKGKRLALIVGVNHTPNSLLPPLKHAVADAEAMAEVLQTSCHFDLLEPPLIDEHATSEKIKTAVLKLARQRTDGDFLLFYFSGHGQPMIIEAGRHAIYLGSSNFQKVDVEDDETLHVSLNWLREKLYEGTKAGRVLLLLDCCFSGDMGKTAPDHYLEDLRKRIAYYFEAPGSESRARSGGLRLALTATGHDTKAVEKDGHGLMTGPLLLALQGEKEEAFDAKGLVSIELLYHYLKKEMPLKQQPSLSGDFAGRSCILASHPERAEATRRKRSHRIINDRPRDFILHPRDPLFQPRPGEFKHLETLLFELGSREKPTRLGFVGMIGMGGIGKTQLAVELSYRCQDQHRFPSGIFWMTAIGTIDPDWQRELAKLADSTDYLPPDDNPFDPGNEARRARYLCRYLADHDDALLVLDNVEDPSLVTTAWSSLIGRELACTILYTSRNQKAPAGVITYSVALLPEEIALRLLLETNRRALLSEVLTGSQNTEAQAARQICRAAGYLPKALVMLRGLLEEDQQASLEQLNESLKQQPDILDAEKKTPAGDLAQLSAIFQLSWEWVREEGARRLFKLAVYFPEASPIPLWLIGLAAGLGESCIITNPLWQARRSLRKMSLMEVLIGNQVRLHPLVRAFGQRLVAEEPDQGKLLLEEAGEKLTTEFTDLKSLENRVLRAGYWGCLEQVRAVRLYLEQIASTRAEAVARIELWLDHESYLLSNETWWPDRLPGLFYQQLFNCSVEAGQPFKASQAPANWVRQEEPVGKEDQALVRIFAGDTYGMLSVTFSHDGRQILTCSKRGTLQQWEVASGRELRRLQGHTGEVSSVAFSPDGQQILTGSYDKAVRLWEVASGRELMRLRHIGDVRSVAFSPDGRQILTGSFDGTVVLWEVASGRKLMRFKGHRLVVLSMAFSPDGQQILTGSLDETVVLWEMASGREQIRFECRPQHSLMSGVSSVAFSSDGQQILTGSLDGTVVLWEMASGRELMCLQGHTGAVLSMAFSPDGQQILTGSYDKTARLWEVASGRELARLQGHRLAVLSMAFSPDGRQVLTGSEDGAVRLWEIVSEREQMRFEEYRDEVSSVAFSPDGRQVLTGSEDGTVRLWEAASGQELMRLQGHRLAVLSMAFSPDGQQILTGSYDKTARLWEAASGRELARLQGHTENVSSVAFSPDGRQVLTGSEDGTVRLWEAASGQELMRLQGHKHWWLAYGVRSVAFSPDGQQILTGSYDKTARLWEVASGRELARLQGHTGAVSSVAFSPDGQQILTGSEDGTARLWKVTSGRELARLQGHTDAVSSVAFSPDGYLAITWGWSGYGVWFWQAIPPNMGRLLAMYAITYKVGAIHWRKARHVTLADTGGQRGRPYLYHLTLEGI